jgi:hypothetical protein
VPPSTPDPLKPSALATLINKQAFKWESPGGFLQPRPKAPGCGDVESHPAVSFTKEAAILSAVAEAVAWKNEALEPEDPPREGQGVVIYPKDLVQLDTVLSTGDPNVDSESGHPIAYERILAHAQISKDLDSK